VELPRAGVSIYQVNVLVEDRKNKNLLFLGSDKGVFVTLDGGKRWFPLRENMPPVVVRDLQIQPDENDLVVGTYGRGTWITDISPLQQFTNEISKKVFYLFDVAPKPQKNYSQQAHWGNYEMMGSNHLPVSNEPNGLEIWYFFKDNATGEKAGLQIFDHSDKKVYERSVPLKKGFHKIYWNTIKAEPGVYKISLSWNGLELVKSGKVLKPWIWPVLNYR